MTKKTSMVTGIMTCAIIGAGVGAAMSAVKNRKVPVRKTVGNAMKAVGSFVEHMTF